MENIPAELICYLCQRQKITACLIVGTSDFYNQVWKLVPPHIRPHFLYHELPDNHQASQSLSRTRDTLEADPLSLLEGRLHAFLKLEDTLHTLVIVDADIYLSEQIPACLSVMLRNMLLGLPFCISIGRSESTDYSKTLDELPLRPSFPTLQGYTSIPRASSGYSSAWIELLGSHFTPSKDQLRPLRVAAIIIAYNESDILEDCLAHLFSQGISTYLIDDESDDQTEDIAMTCLEKGILAGYERSGLPEDCERRWAELLAISQKKAQTLDADWIIHHDADEIRESPWKDIKLSEAISIVDSLGYNCIDHTVVEFLFTPESIVESDEGVGPSAVQNLPRFRFPSHGANFNQLKGWKKADWIKTVDGGHKVELQNQFVFPLKFLIKHYPLRSLTHARKKVLTERSTRFSAERKLSGWHVHYDSFQHFEEINPWARRELHLFNNRTFYSEFLIERLSGCGLDQTDYIDLNLLTSKRIIEKQEEFRSKVAQAVGIDLMSIAVLSRKNSSDPLWVTQTNTLLESIQDLLESRNQALNSNRILLAEQDHQRMQLESAIKQHSTELENLHSNLNLIHSRLQWNRDRLKESQETQQIWQSLAMRYHKIIKSMIHILSRTTTHLRSSSQRDH